MAQATRDLILQYGRTQVGSPIAKRLHRRLRKRAQHDDDMALAFLTTRFEPADVAGVERQLLAWLGRWG